MHEMLVPPSASLELDDFKKLVNTSLFEACEVVETIEQEKGLVSCRFIGKTRDGKMVAAAGRTWRDTFYDLSWCYVRGGA